MKNKPIKKLSFKEKKQLYLAIGFIITILLTLLEFKIQDFSPWNQMLETITVPLLLIIGLLVYIFFRKKIFVTKAEPTNMDYLREVIVSLVIAATLTIPILGLTSLTNRSIGHQTIYKLKGDILKIDSISVYNNSTKLTSTVYSVKLTDNHSEKQYEFNISEKEYRSLKGKTEIEKDVKKGFWGYLYEN